MKKSALPSRSDSDHKSANVSAAQAKRRRVLPLATATAAAAMGLAGCGALSWPGAAQETPPPAPASQQELATERVKQFTSNIDIALDQVDRDRLRAAAEKKNQAAAAAAAPAASVVSAGQAPVLFASSNNAAAPEPAPHLAPIPAGSAVSAAPAAVSTPATAAEQPTPVKSSVATPPATPVPRIAQEAPTAAEPQLALANTSAARIPSAEKPAAPSEGTDTTAVVTPMNAPPASPPTAMGSMTAITTAAPEKPAAPATVATPVIAASAAQPTLDQALDIVRQRVAAHPTLNTALALALLDSGDDKAADVGKSLSPNDQKVFTDLLVALQGMNAADTASTGAAPTLAQRAAPLVDAAKKWQADADLSLPRLALASRVDSFGVYTAVEPKFEQGKKHTVIIYCEVASFSSKKSDDGWYQTSLSQQETLITDDGLLVWRPNAEEVEDRSLNQRRDFYLVKKLTIPDNLAAGKYTLRMSVTDRNTNKIAMVSLPVEIQ